jgi:membrane protease YdiL (CAAX protease family)
MFGPIYRSEEAGGDACVPDIFALYGQNFVGNSTFQYGVGVMGTAMREYATGSKAPLWAASVFSPSLVFGWAFDRYKNICAPVVLHFAYNWFLLGGSI